MKPLQFVLGAALFTIGLHAGADDAVSSVGIRTNDAGLESLDVMRVSPCKSSGDGSYVEIVTTMASVLPPELGDALLARYCDECNRKKFALSQPRR